MRVVEQRGCSCPTIRGEKEEDLSKRDRKCLKRRFLEKEKEK